MNVLLIYGVVLRVHLTRQQWVLQDQSALTLHHDGPLPSLTGIAEVGLLVSLIWIIWLKEAQM